MQLDCKKKLVYFHNCIHIEIYLVIKSDFHWFIIFLSKSLLSIDLSIESLYIYWKQWYWTSRNEIKCQRQTKVLFWALIFKWIVQMVSTNWRSHNFVIKISNLQIVMLLVIGCIMRLNLTKPNIEIVLLPIKYKSHFRNK